MNDGEFYVFLGDQDLWRLIEKCKSTEDVFDLIELGENQNSDVLRWLFSPNEGHGQSDAILKDVLMYAATAARTQAIRGRTQAFFKNWTAGRIATTSFGSAFVMREHQVAPVNGKSKGRLDLLVVDPVNKFMVVVENKRGHVVSEGQLEKYAEYISGVAGKSLFREFDVVQILLDDDFDDESPIANAHWVHINYLCLKASAERAQSPAYRNLEGSKLLLSYFRKQVDWWSDGPHREISRLAAKLAWRHKGVAEVMKAFRAYKIHDWDRRKLQGERWEMAVFQSQYRGACDEICDSTSLAAIQHLIEDKTGIIDDAIYSTKRYVAATSPRIYQFRVAGTRLWPVCVCVLENGGKFDVALEWRPRTFSANLNDEARNKMQARLCGLFTALKGKSGNANPRLKGLSTEQAVDLAARTIVAIEECLPNEVP